jgi:hypothetical protein
MTFDNFDDENPMRFGPDGMPEYDLGPVVVKADAVMGMALMICFMRDLYTGTPKDVFTREEILVHLRTLAECEDLFPNGEGVQMWESD